MIEEIKKKKEIERGREMAERNSRIGADQRGRRNKGESAGRFTDSQGLFQEGRRDGLEDRRQKKRGSILLCLGGCRGCSCLEGLPGRNTREGRGREFLQEGRHRGIGDLGLGLEESSEEAVGLLGSGLGLELSLLIVGLEEGEVEGSFVVSIDAEDREAQTDQKRGGRELVLTDGPVQDSVPKEITDVEGGADFVEAQDKGLLTQSRGQMEGGGTFMIAREGRSSMAEEGRKEGELVGGDAALKRTDVVRLAFDGSAVGTRPIREQRLRVLGKGLDDGPVEWGHAHLAVIGLVGVRAGVDQHFDEDDRVEGTVEAGDVVEQAVAPLVSEGGDLRVATEELSTELEGRVGSHKEIDDAGGQET